MTRLEIGPVRDFNGGVHDKSLIERLRITIENENFPLDYRNEIQPVCRDIGFSGPHIVRNIGRKKLAISGTYKAVGLMIWFGNQHTLFKHLLNLQLLFIEGSITSAIYITSTAQETIDRPARINAQKGINSNSKSANYSEFESTVAYIEEVSEMINIPLTVIGLVGNYE